MIYYLIEISYGDSKIAGKGMYDFSSRDAAEANYHLKFGNAMRSELYTGELVMVINSEGGIELPPLVWHRKSDSVVDDALN